MKPVEIEEAEGTRKVLLAKNQPQYGSLPALVYPDGVVLSRWQPTFDERRAIADGANVDLWVWTFGRPHQPVNLQVQGVQDDFPDRDIIDTDDGDDD